MGISASNSNYHDDVAASNGYQLPPAELRDIVDSPPVPYLTFSPNGDRILFLKRTSLPALADLARPEEKLAGIRIDAQCNIRSQMPFYTGIEIHRVTSESTTVLENVVHGLPDGAKIQFVTWSSNCEHLAFTVCVNEDDGSSSKLLLWVANVATGEARPLFQSTDINVNAVCDNFVWVGDSTLLVCTIPASRGTPPKKPLVPPAPKIQSNEEKKTVQNRTNPDLLKDEYDADLFDYYTTSRLVLASLDGKTEPFGEAGVYISLDPSPDNNYIIITSLHRPYSYAVPCGRFPTKVDLWTADGKFVRQICDLPLAENVPITRDSVRQGMRFIKWRADKPSILSWVETQDGGDAKVEVSPRDIVYTQPAEASEGDEPTILHKLDLRYAGISWCDDSLALVSEMWYKTRKTRTWVVSPGSKDVSPRILFDRSAEDAYSDPGTLMLQNTSDGSRMIARVRKENDDATYVLLFGNGATRQGNIPFLDLLDIETGKKERLWESDTEKYNEKIVNLLSGQNEGDILLSELKLIISKESKTERTQYYIRLQSWPDKKAYQITNYPDPYPQLASVQKEMIRYKRKDGVELTATLYLPPGYDQSKDSPLPCLVWAYPKEFNSKDAAGQVRKSPNEFPTMEPTSPLLWLTRRFAILDGPTIPIIGEGGEEANDTFVEQVVASAEAAVEEVIRRGVADPSKIAIGGHSYGAFMAANLMAHAPHLFCCGIARSGAYNRTLTPFGFQNEVRSLWEATDTYVKMSPFMAANKIKKPILLIHGDEDNNAGTMTMQSERFYNALAGQGTVCRLVVLPYESHSYSARESIMHVLWETDRWLHKHCILNMSEVSAEKKEEASGE